MADVYRDGHCRGSDDCLYGAFFLVEQQEIIDNNGIKYAEKYFQWSILETLPLNVPAKVAIKRESLYKKKLDTIKHGYNEN